MKNILKEKLFKKRENKKETLFEFTLTILSCWLISIGTCLIVDSQFTFNLEIKDILWQTLIVLVAAVLFTRRWWIPIIYFGVLVPVFFLAISLSGDIGSFFESFAGFIKWWISNMPYDSKWYSDEGFYLVHTFMNIGITVLYFAAARIFKRTWVVAAIAIGFVVFNYASGYTGYNILAVPFLVVGIFPFVAGEKFQNIKFREFKNMFGIWGKKTLYVTIATLVAVAVSTLAFGLVSGTSGSVRNRVCSDAVADIQTVANAYTKEQKQLNITLFDLGLVMNSTYIGGNLYNIEPEIIAATDLTEPTLIKMTSFSTFNGKMWTNAFEKSYRINGFWNKNQNMYLAGEGVGNSDFLKAAEDVGYKSDVTVTLSRDMDFLPTTGQILGFSEKTSTANPVLYDKRGRLFSYYGFKSGYTYTLQTLVYDTKQKASDKQMTAFIKQMDNSSYDTQSEFYSTYTQLPEKVPQDLTKALKSLKLEDKNPYRKAAAICNYFSSDNGFVYMNEPNDFKRGDNVLEKLFKNKKGHCVYYATAMTVMARQAGIPTRFVAGYKTVKNPNGEKQVIDVSSPYAWVECYIPNIGWITFDPAPEININPNNKDKNQVALNQQTKVPDVEVEIEVEKEEQKVAGTNIKWKETFNTSLIVVLSALVLIILIVAFNTLFSQKFYNLKAVRKRFSSKEMQFEFYFHDILRQFVWLGFRFKKGETLKELALRVCEILTPDECEILMRGISYAQELHYGGDLSSDVKVESIFETRKMLEKLLKYKNNKLLYCVKRRLLLPIFDLSLKKYKK